MGAEDGNKDKRKYCLETTSDRPGSALEDPADKIPRQIEVEIENFIYKVPIWTELLAKPEPTGFSPITIADKRMLWLDLRLD